VKDIIVFTVKLGGAGKKLGVQEEKPLLLCSIGPLESTKKSPNIYISLLVQYL